MTGGAEIYDKNSSSSFSRWMPQMGSTPPYPFMNAAAARESVISPPERAFIATKPMSAASQARTTSISSGEAR